MHQPSMENAGSFHYGLFQKLDGPILLSGSKYIQSQAHSCIKKPVPENKYLLGRKANGNLLE